MLTQDARFDVQEFPADYAIAPVELATAVAERRLDSLFFPDHTNIPAPLDVISGGRFVTGISAGGNREEIENHGANHKRRWAEKRESVLALLDRYAELAEVQQQ